MFHELTLLAAARPFEETTLHINFSCSSQQKQLKDAVKVIGSGSLLFASYLTVVGDERFYANQLMPLLQRIVGAETAHVLAVKIIRLGLVPLNRYQDPPSMVSQSSLAGNTLHDSRQNFI